MGFRAGKHGAKSTAWAQDGGSPSLRPIDYLIFLLLVIPSSLTFVAFDMLLGQGSVGIFVALLWLSLILFAIWRYRERATQHR